MYARFFGLKREPFSIAPDPRYLYMSERHREALAHLLYGVEGGGGVVLLTGEIGAGKTTVCRCFLEQIPRRCNVAYIFNPKLTVNELLKSICDEFGIAGVHRRPSTATVKEYIDPLNEFLLASHANGQNNVLIIDEAQNLSTDVLEQLRLLTNLETNERKLLQIILIGQPELRQLLAKPELEQLAQRVIARFHLEALSESETVQYIRHRLSVAGMSRASPFGRRAMKRIYELSRGVPRRINLLCDRALLGAYAESKHRVDAPVIDKAAHEVFGKPRRFDWMTGWTKLSNDRRRLALGIGGGALAVAALAVAAWTLDFGRGSAALAGAGASTPASGAASTVGAPAVSAGRAASSGPAASAGKLARSAAAAASGPAPTDDALVVSPAQLKTAFPALVRDEKEAWRTLGQRWNLALEDATDPCQAAQRQQVACFRNSSGLALIQQLARPGIVTLHDEADAPVYALLTGLTDRTATLAMGGVSRTLTLISLATMWRGEFATLWRAPPGYTNPVNEGASGPVVEALARQIAAVRGEPPPQRAVLDAALKARVAAFQLAHGLKPDGVAGPTTFMQLNRATGVSEPRLIGK